MEQKKDELDLEKKIKICLKAGKGFYAAKLAEDAGLFKRAFEIYMAERWFESAIELSPKLGVDYVVKELLARGELVLAGRAAEKGGQIERALAIYQEGKWIGGMAQCAERAGLFEKALELYLQIKKPFEVEDFVGRAKERLMAKKDYERIVQLYLRIGHKQKATDVMFQAGQYERAIEMRMKTGRTQDEAEHDAEYLAKKAEEVLFPKGEYERIVDLYMACRRPLEALRVAEKAGMPLDKIIAKYEKQECKA